MRSSRPRQRAYPCTGVAEGSVAAQLERASARGLPESQSRPSAPAAYASARRRPAHSTAHMQEGRARQQLDVCCMPPWSKLHLLSGAVLAGRLRGGGRRALGHQLACTLARRPWHGRLMLRRHAANISVFDEILHFHSSLLSSNLLATTGEYPRRARTCTSLGSASRTFRSAALGRTRNGHLPTRSAPGRRCPPVESATD